jgi:hypothetical protein
LISSGYEETRKKSGPKQGYVKKLEQKSQTLEQRLAQLEKLLATHQGQQSSSPSVSNHHLPTPPGISPLPFENMSAPASSASKINQFSFASSTPTGMNTNLFQAQQMLGDLTPPDSTNMNLTAFPLFSNDPSPGVQSVPESGSSNPLDAQWAWDMVALGMAEELPPDELTNKL